MGGGGEDVTDASSRLGLPADLVKESEGFRYSEGGIYPDNMRSVNIFNDMMTQWNVGASGVTGLNYMALWNVIFRVRKVPVSDREDIFNDVQIMERAALNHVHRENK